MNCCSVFSLSNMSASSVFVRFRVVLTGLGRSGTPVRSFSNYVRGNWPWGQRAMTKKIKMLTSKLITSLEFLGFSSVFAFAVPRFFLEKPDPERNLVFSYQMHRVYTAR